MGLQNTYGYGNCHLFISHALLTEVLAMVSLTLRGVATVCFT